MLIQLLLLENSDDFFFGNQMLAQCVYFGFCIGEVSRPTKILRRNIPDQLPKEREIRLRSEGDSPHFPPAEDRAGQVQALQPEATPDRFAVVRFNGNRGTYRGKSRPERG